MVDPRRWWKRFKRSNRTATHVATLASGAGAGQVFSLALMPVLARLYSPADFGVFAFYSSLVLGVAGVAALRYDLAVMLPASNREARGVVRLATFSAAAAGVLTVLLLVGLRPLMGPLLGGKIQTWWLMAAGCSTFLVAETSTLQYWLNRQTLYRVIASNRFLQIVLVGVFQVGLGLVSAGAGSLIGGMLLGQLITLSVLFVRTRRSLDEFSHSGRLSVLARRYWRMPLLNGPLPLLDAVRLNGTNYLMSLISVAALGEYSMAWRFIAAPATLVQAAIGQVFYQRMATAEQGSLFALTARVTRTLALISLPLYGAAFLLSPWLLPAILGTEWKVAGVMAQGLSIWMLASAISAPLSNVFIVTGKQAYALVFGVVFTLAPLAYLGLVSLRLSALVLGLGLLMGGLLLVKVGLALHLAASFDRGAGG